MINQSLKKGQAELIAQAWAKHEADRVRVSQEPAKIRQVLETEHFSEMQSFLTDETFVQTVNLSDGFVELGGGAEKSVQVAEKVKPPDKLVGPFLTEVYTTAQAVSKEALKRGHAVGDPMSLETGWNFLNPEHREKCKELVRKAKPYCLVVAFPSGPFSPLQRLNPRGGPDPKQLADGRVLMKFGLELAAIQLSEGRHVVLENPLPSAAWKEVEMRKFIEENDVQCAVFDQCRFLLRSLEGKLHKKPTQMICSSSSMAARLDGVRCKRDHEHAPVIGQDFPVREVFAVDEAEEEEVGFGGDGALALRPEPEDDEDLEELGEDKKMVIPAGVKLAIKRLHENTGHRSAARLARALAISGAPPEAIVAAKRHRCAVCEEKAAPRTRRPMSLPVPKDMSDQVHIDLVEIEDAAEQKYYVAHATDHATRFQAAEVLPDKSTKAVIGFMMEKWLPTFGPPRVLVCDQGREFVSWEMEEWASSQSIMLHHVAVQAPWQNGVAEKSGGILKTIMASLVTSKSVIGAEEMKLALSEAVMAYNSDIGETGASPYQAAIGRQPRMVGDVLGGIQNRLAEHGLIESSPSLARQIALRETARLALTRLHYSKGLRRAELARSRSKTVEKVPEPGDICYFYRPLRYNNKSSVSRKRLTLKRWHGPALLVAVEGSASAFLSFKGQLTKCALEHVRLASTMEQIAAGSWKEAIEEAVQDVTVELTQQGIRDAERAPPEDGVEAPRDQDALENPAVVQAPPTPGILPSSSAVGVGGDLPPVVAQELVNAMVPVSGRGSSHVGGSTLPSRRISDVTQGTPAPGTPVGGLMSRVEGRPLLERQLERAQQLDEASGLKRPADGEAEDLRGDVKHRAMSSSGQDDVFDALVLSKSEVLESIAQHSSHPLVQLYNEACRGRQDPTECAVLDHGSWDGRWSLPSRSEWLARSRLKLQWPTGIDDAQEACAVQAARKEYFWRNMSAEEKVSYREAAEQAWSVWAENDAVEILSDEESKRIRQRLQANKENCKILTPRYVFTDKHDGLRTSTNPLPLKARARIIVPGFKDVLAYEIRKDAPTASRISQHMVFILAASNHKAKRPWRLMSADVKSAFLKGDPYMDGSRELYMENIRGHGDEPRLPFRGALAKIRKGVFGLADAPRQWYLRLNRALLEEGWERSCMDYACWMLWSADRTVLEGVIVSHVDDLLLGGTLKAQESLLRLGQQLGFGSVEYDDFVYCGKRIRQHEDGSISLSMEEYHTNLKPVQIPVHRRSCPEAELNDGERRQLRAVLGSLQWLVAQLRFDLGFHLSTLQGEKPKVQTLMKANQLLKKFKQNSDFKLVFRPMDLSNAGIMVVSDASLGNVTRSGGVDGEVSEKVYSQSAYFVLVADKNLMAGRSGNFAVLDARSHRLPRVCRSTYGAELMGVEEAFDVGQYCRGILAVFMGYPINVRKAEAVMEAVPLAVVTDAKDTFDKCGSDTPTYGAQKSLAFSVSWVRGMLLRPNTALRWTSTENMFVDAGTKDMELEHMHKILGSGRWSFVYDTDFVKQPSKSSKKKAQPLQNGEMPGKPLDAQSPIFPYLQQLSSSPGWHRREGVVIHVAKEARAYRTPNARFPEKDFPFRTTYARVDHSDGRSEWRVLEESESYAELKNAHQLLGIVASILISIFRSLSTKENNQLKNALCCTHVDRTMLSGVS